MGGSDGQIRQFEALWHLPGAALPPILLSPCPPNLCQGADWWLVRFRVNGGRHRCPPAL